MRYLNFFIAQTATKESFAAWLQDRFLALIHATCAKIVSWLAVFHVWLYGISVSSKREPCKLIPLEIGFQAFYLSQFIFKFCYAIGETRLLLLAGECNSGRLHELCVNLVDCGNKLIVISTTMSNLEKFTECFETLDRRRNFGVHK